MKGLDPVLNLEEEKRIICAKRERRYFQTEAKAQRQDRRQ